VAVRIWSPADAEDSEPLPLLVSNDGPEYAELAGLTGYSAAMIESGALPPHRVALVAPGVRNEWYSASPLYAGALVRGVLPAVAAEVAVRGLPVAIGASLGALAMLHAQHRHPNTFAGLFLQSGSFFTPEHDIQERGFSRWARVTAFVAEVLGGGRGTGAAPAVLTCGAGEENIHNNREMAAALGEQLHELGDLHNYTAWRDALDPYLTGLLEDLW
jgi:enterochelin esterase family protein